MVKGRQEAASTARHAHCSGQAEQQEVIEFLTNPATHGGAGPVERFETHGNLVFLAGSDAWKIKRAVRFAYMDFSTLEKRRAACLREVDINRRLAPQLYLGCDPITRSQDGGLALGGTGPVVEWAVHMRRFEQSALLSNIAAAQGISLDLAKAVADAAYASHEQADRAAAVSGTAPIRDLIALVGGALDGAFGGGNAASFAEAAERHVRGVGALLDERARQGFVRRCHGDLHLANIVLWEGRPVFYDAIEFDESVATIDTLYDLAFLIMDLDQRGQRRAANVVLNRYLWRSNQELDLEGLAALPLFLALRAGIRAMVTAERAAQEPVDAAVRDMDAARAYLAAALAYARPQPPRLIAIGGLSGTGKSTLGAALAPQTEPAPGAVHLRSDLERKTLLGVGETERLPAAAYAQEVGDRVYDILLRKARLALSAGQSVMVDAVYADLEKRRCIEAAAAELGVPFRGLWLHADPERLVARVAARRDDASDATPEVVRAQLSGDVGELSPSWTRIAAGGTAGETLALASAEAGIGAAELERQR